MDNKRKAELLRAIAEHYRLDAKGAQNDTWDEFVKRNEITEAEKNELRLLFADALEHEAEFFEKEEAGG